MEKVEKVHNKSSALLGLTFIFTMLLGGPCFVAVSQAKPLALICSYIKPESISPDIRPISTIESARADTLMSDARALQEQGSYQKAEPIWRESVNLAEVTWGPNHPLYAARLGDLGANLRYQGQYAKAEPLLRRALAINRSRLGKSHPSTIDSLSNLATDIDDLGRYDLAESMYREAISLSLPKCRSNTFIVGNLAYNLLNQGRYKEGEALFRRVLQLEEASSSASKQDIATDYANLASSLEKLGVYSEAEAMYRKALDLDRVSLGEGHPETAADLNNLAFNLDHQGKLIEAETFHRRALAIDQASIGGKHPDSAGTQSGLGRNLFLQKRYNQAASVLDEALSIQDLTLGPNHPDTLLTARYLGETKLEMMRPYEAFEIGSHVLAAQSSARILARASASEDRRAQINGLTGLAASVVVRAAWELGEKGNPMEVEELRAKAFEAAQLLSTSPAGDALGQSVVRSIANNAGAGNYTSRWREAQESLEQIDKQITAAAALGSPGDSLRAQLSTKRVETTAILSKAKAQLKARFPRFFDLIKLEPVTVGELQTIADHQGILRPDEVLILINPGAKDLSALKSRGLIFAITADNIGWAEIGLTPEMLIKSIDSVHEQLANGGATRTTGGPDPGAGFDRQGAYELYESLFSDSHVQNLLNSKQRWIIVPQGPLLSLPFAALVTDPPLGGTAGNADPESLRATHWLGIEHTLSFSPSVATLRVQRLFPILLGRNASTPFFGIGDPVFNRRENVLKERQPAVAKVGPMRDYFNGQVADLEELARLPRLEGTANEIKNLAKSFGAKRGSYLLQLRATELAVRHAERDGSLSKARVVAFATHGLLAGQLQDSITEPALALTPPSTLQQRHPSSLNDGLLTASEAARLHLTADWLILSACNTAAPDGESTESLTGLARSFLYSGSQSILVTHYPVFDDAAEFLTTEAVRLAAKNHLSNPEALRLAMAALLNSRTQDEAGRSYAHPSAWAAFMIIDAR